MSFGGMVKDRVDQRKDTYSKLGRGDLKGWAKGEWDFADQAGVFRGGGSDFARKKFESLAGLNDDDVAKHFDVKNNFGKSPLHNTQFRNDQLDFIKALQMQAAGQGPSLANAVANQQSQQGLNQIMAQQASNRGINPALAARSAQMASANLGAQVAQQALQGRLQEQLNAQNQLGGALTNFRGQDQAFQGQKLDLNKTKALAQLQEELQAQNLNAQGDLQSRKLRAEQLSKTRDFWQKFGPSIGGGFAKMAAMGG